jgi:hypothetical protein
MSGPVTEERRVPVPRPAGGSGLRMDPRIARRWVEVRRQEGRRRLRILIAVAAILLVGALLAGSLYTPIFKVRHVRVTVVGSVPASSVAARSGISGRTLMVRVNDAKVERRLDAVPGLGNARVSTHWPGTVSIRVAVRTPVAVIETPSAPTSAPAQSPPRWSEVDSTGRVIAVVNLPPSGLPLIEGVGVPPAEGQWVPGSAGESAPVATAAHPTVADLNAMSDGPSVPQGVAAALALAASLPQQIRGSVQAIEMSQPGGQNGAPAATSVPGRVLYLTVAPTEGSAGPLTVALGDGSQLAAKLTALTTLLTQTSLSGITGLDLSVPDRPAALTGQKSPDSLSTHSGGSH